MEFSNKNISVLFAAISSLLFPVQPIQASEYGAGSIYTSHNLPQHQEDWRQFELSAGQARSLVQHTLVNYLLGRTVDQYLDFGTDDNTGRKSSKRLKLRLNEHRIALIYQSRF